MITEKTKSKGERLDALLDEAAAIHSQMRELFAKNNIDALDLKKLPEADRNEWLRLNEKSNELSMQMVDVIIK